MPRKIRELIRDLKEAGFVDRKRQREPRKLRTSKCVEARELYPGMKEMMRSITRKKR